MMLGLQLGSVAAMVSSAKNTSSFAFFILSLYRHNADVATIKSAPTDTGLFARFTTMLFGSGTN
jgi:hypothetical protein